MYEHMIYYVIIQVHHHVGFVVRSLPIIHEGTGARVEYGPAHVPATFRESYTSIVDAIAMHTASVPSASRMSTRLYELCPDMMLEGDGRT